LKTQGYQAIINLQALEKQYSCNIHKRYGYNNIKAIYDIVGFYLPPSEDITFFEVFINLWKQTKEEAKNKLI